MRTAFDFDTLTNRDDFGCAKWARRTQAEKAAGIVPLSIADMEFRCAPCVIEAVQRAAEHGVYGYTDPDEPYYTAVMDWMKKRHGWAIEKEWIVPENGVVPALSVAVRAFTEPGDRVLMQPPGYGPFTGAVKSNGREPVFSSLRLGEDGLYRMDLADLAQKASDSRVKLFLLCSPHNPVGRIWTPEELQAVADICCRNDVLVVSDEIHFDMELYGKHIVFPLAAPGFQDQCMVLTAPSKTFNLAGLQLANSIISNPDLRARYSQRLYADGYGNIAYFGYHATIAAYREGEPWLNALLDYVRSNFDLMGRWFKENLPQVKLLPVQGTYLAWTDWRGFGMPDEALRAFVRKEAMLFVGEGIQFGLGGEGFMRFNLALPRAELEKALHRLLDAVRRQGK